MNIGDLINETSRYLSHPVFGGWVWFMGKVLRDMPPLVSIGGAGVFDGIFLSGALAVALSALL